MSDQEWDLLEFVERFRNGEYDGKVGETLDSLSSEQIEDLHSLLMQSECRDGIVLDDLKLSVR